ncbi:hypothetical protein Tco_0086296 [Tanacetum coccineum]
MKILENKLESLELQENQPEYLVGVFGGSIELLEELVEILDQDCVWELVHFRSLTKSSPKDVIHGGTSSDVALSNEFPDLDDTILNTNGKSTEVDIPLDTEVRDDDDDFIYDIDDVAHDIGSDDEVDPTDDEFAEMAISVAPSYHGGDAGGDPPERPNGLLPHQCAGSGQRGPTTLQALKTAYKKNNNKRLEVEFDYKDQKTFRPVGGYSSNLISLIGNLVKNLPLDYDTWEQILETTRVSILPELQGGFNLEPHLNDQTMIRVGKTDKTVGSMVELGLLQSQAAWEKQVDWWDDPKRVEKVTKNAENRSKKRTATYQGSKSFAQGRHEYFVKKGRYPDLITHWRDRHSHEGVFDNSENEDLYARMKSIKDQVNARTIEFKSDKEIITEVTKSTNREHESGVGRRLPVGTGSSSRISPEPNQDYCTREQITEIIRQEVADKERWKKAAEEAKQEAELAKQEAELAKQEAKLANERAARVELVLDKFMGHYNQQQTQAGGRSFTPPPLLTTLVPGTVSTSIPDPYFDPNRYQELLIMFSNRTYRLKSQLPLSSDDNGQILTKIFQLNKRITEQDNDYHDIF